MLNAEWLFEFQTIVTRLNRHRSDHAPLVINVSHTNFKGSAFRFLNVWTKHHQFMQLVEDSWSIPTNGKPLVTFHLKLKELKKRLQMWNREVFGNINQSVKNTEC